MNRQENKNTGYVFPDVIKRLMEAKRLRYEQQVAEALGFSKTAFTERKRRNAIPMKELVTYCEQEKLNLNWILTGDTRVGMVAEPPAPWREPRHPDPEIQAVIEMMEGMDHDTKQDIRLSVEKEKLLRELLRQKVDRETG